MDLATRIELFTAALLLILGASHIAAPAAWSGLFADLLQRPYAGLWIGMLTLPLGLLLILTHNIWVADLGLITTLLGWSWAIKGTLYLLVPGWPARRFKLLVQHPKHFMIAGVFLCAFGVGILANVFPIAS
jgi:uncharacterized protein YjeT (DUF2065 family)